MAPDYCAAGCSELLARLEEQRSFTTVYMQGLEDAFEVPVHSVAEPTAVTDEA